MAYEPPSQPPTGGYGGPGVPGGSYPGGPVPGGYPQQSGGVPPQNYLVWAILSTVLCCLPLGIASIVFSTQVNSKWAMGDVQGAMDSSRKAKNFAIASAAVTLVGGVLYGIAIAMGAATGMFGTTTTTP